MPWVLRDELWCREGKGRALQVEVMTGAKEQRGHTWVWMVNSE